MPTLTNMGTVRQDCELILSCALAALRFGLSPCHKLVPRSLSGHVDTSFRHWNRYNRPALRWLRRGREDLCRGRLREGVVRKRRKTPFDPKIFLAKVGEGKTISKYRKDQIIFSQGQVADAVFTSRKARSSSPSFPSMAKKPSSQFWDPATFSAKDVSMGMRCASRQRGRWTNARLRAWRRRR